MYKRQGQEAIAGVSVPEIDSRIDALQRNMDAMLQRFTEKHPDIVSTRRLIKELEDKKREEIAARRKAAATNPTSSTTVNPVQQQLKISLSETEARVAAMPVSYTPLDVYQRQALLAEHDAA